MQYRHFLFFCLLKLDLSVAKKFDSVACLLREQNHRPAVDGLQVRAYWVLEYQPIWSTIRYLFDLLIAFVCGLSHVPI